MTIKMTKTNIIAPKMINVVVEMELYVTIIVVAFVLFGVAVLLLLEV